MASGPRPLHKVRRGCAADLRLSCGQVSHVYSMDETESKIKSAESLMQPQGHSAVQSSQKWIRRLAVAGLVLATIAAYSRISRNGFVNFDDQTYITRNRHISQGLSFEGVIWAFTEYYSCNWHPVTWLSHMIDVELFGMWAGGHHLMSLGIHVSNTLLLLWFLLSATKRFWPSIFVAGLFALHPLRVESVAWVSERKDVLSAFFWLATMVAYSFYVRKPGWRRYSAVAVLFALGLMSKPMLVTLPLVLLLLDWWPFERVAIGDGCAGKSVPWLRLAAEKLPLLAMSAVSALVTIHAQRGAVAALDVVGFSTRLTNAAISYWRYLGQMLWPARLAVLYPYVNRPQYLQAAVALLLLAGATVAAVRWRYQLRYVLTGWLWYLVALLPVIGLVQVGEQSHADRYTYLPLTGIFIIISCGVSDLSCKAGGLHRVIPAVAVAILMIMSVLTWRQTGYWKDSVTLFDRTTAVTRDNHVAMTNLGNALIDIGESERAMEQFRISLDLAPRKAQTLTGIGKILFDSGELDTSWQYYQMAVKLRPDLKDAQLNAGSVLIALGRYAEAEMYLREAIRLDPCWAEPYAQLGIALGGTGRTEEGIAACQKALELKPGLYAAHFSLGALYAMEGAFASAVEEYRKCLAFGPNYSVLKNLGGCLLAMGRHQEALEKFREAASLKPESAESHHNIALALEGLGLREEAADEVRKALHIDPDNEKLNEYLRVLTGENQ